MKDWIKPILELGACRDALEWAESYDSLDEAWAACERGDRMLWLAGRLAGPPRTKSRRKLVLTACPCARLALPYVPKGEMRPLKAMETAEAWARQEPGITLRDVREVTYAAFEAYAAANAAYTAAYAANAAANAAAYAANAANAARRKEIQHQCADIVREHYPRPPILKQRREV